MTVHGMGSVVECDGCGRDAVIAASRAEYSHPMAQPAGDALKGWLEVGIAYSWNPPRPVAVNLCPSCAATTTVAALVREATEEES